MSEKDKIIDAGIDLSTWAASINWRGGRNTILWLRELEEKIVTFQDLAKAAGYKIGGMETRRRAGEPGTEVME